MLVDLTHPVRTGMPVWPGDPEVVLTPAATIGSHGYNLLALRLGSQSGTHVDAPFHVDDALPKLAELPLERFTGPAVVADLRALGPGAPITPADLTPVAARLAPGVVLLLATGWSAHWGTPAYGDHPWLTAEAARLAVDAGVRTVGIDAPSIDPPGPELAAHRVLAGAGAVIAENLTNLALLVGAAEVTVWIMPLALENADGSPVRAVARTG